MTSEHDNDAIAAAWFDHLKRDRGLSDNTITTYQRTLRTITFDLLSATYDDVAAWTHSRAHLAVATRNNEIAALRSFYRWALAFDHLTRDPTARTYAPKQPKGLPRPISRADLHKILDAADPEVRRAICLGAYGGLRISEAAALMWADVDTETRRIRVTGKGGKTRLVGLSPLLLDELLPDTGGNVVTGTDAVYSAATMQRRVNRSMRRAGVTCTYHQLRHRYATIALATTSNLLAVSRALGHSSPATTAVYAATSDADLDVIADAVCR